MGGSKLRKYRLPHGWLAAAIGACLLPLLLAILPGGGRSFGTGAVQLAGGLTWRIDAHLLITAALLFYLSLAHFHLQRKSSVLLLGWLLMLTALPDMVRLHPGAVEGGGALGSGVAVTAGLVEMTLRLAAASILLVGLSWLALGGACRLRRDAALLSLLAAGILLAAWLGEREAAERLASAPSAAVIGQLRLGMLLTLVPLALAGTVFLPRLKEREPSLLASAVTLSLLPRAAAQLYLALTPGHPLGGAPAAGLLLWAAYLLATAAVCWDLLRAHRERSQAAEKSYLRAVIDLIPHYVFTRDREGRITLANQAVADFYGLTVDELEGRNLLEVHPERWQAEQYLHEDHELLAKGGSVSHALEEIIDGRGRHRWNQIYKRTLVPEGGGDTQILSVCIDMTDRCRAEEALRASESYLRTAIDASRDAIICIDERGLITIFNPAAERMFVRTQEEMLGQPLDALMPPEYRGRHRKYISGYFREGQPSAAIDNVVVLPAVRSDGTTFPMEISLSTGKSGDQRFVLGVARDVAQRERSEAALRENEEKYRTIFETASVSIWELEISELRSALQELVDQGVSDFRGYLRENPGFAATALEKIHTLDVNDATVRLFKADHKGDLMQGFEEMLTDESQAAFPEMLIAAAEGRIHYRGEVVFRTLTGEKIHTLLWIRFPSPRSASGRVLVCMVDITDRIRAEAALRESEGRQQLLMETMNDGLAMVDQDGLFTYINEPFLRMIGHESEQMLGRHVQEFLTEESKAVHTQQMARRRLGSRDSYELTWQRRSGGQLPTIISPSPLYDGEGRYIGSVAIIVDISEIRQTEEQLRRAKEAAEAASAAKSDFLANVSHEIRTPMNSVLGVSELLLHMDLSAEQEHYVRMIRESGDTLLNIIDDILDVSRIEAGQVSLDECPCSLLKLVEGVAMMQAYRAAEKGLDLIVRFEPHAPRQVVGDAGRIRQVLVNLVHNAIKFTEQGYVYLNVTCVDKERTRARYRFEVRDTGIGIPAVLLPRVFEKFTQADASTTRRYGGAGLGLNICSQLVERMDGEIGVESEPDRGSTFWFELDLPLAPHRRIRVRPAVALGGARVLLCSSNPVWGEVVREQLVQEGIRCETARSAAEALRLLRRAKIAATPFQLVIVDDKLPDDPGLGFAVRVRAEEGYLAAGIVLASQPDYYSLPELWQAGFDALLPKPVYPSRLLQLMQEAWQIVTCTYDASALENLGENSGGAGATEGPVGAAGSPEGAAAAPGADDAKDADGAAGSPEGAAAAPGADSERSTGVSPEAGTGCDSGAGSKAGAEPDAGAKATGATVTGTTATGATATGTTATGATATGTTATGATSRSAGKGRRKGRGRKGVGGKGSGRKTSDSKASGGKRSGRREPRVQEDVTGGPGARGTVARKSGVRGPRFQGDVTRKSGAREPDPRGAEPQAPNTRGISRRGPILDGDSRETHGRQGPVGRKPTVLGEPIFEANILVAEDNPFNQKVAVLMLEMLGCRVDIAQSGTEAVRLFASAPYDLVFMDCQMPEMDGYETTAAILELEQGGTHTPIIAMTAHAMKGARQECLKAGMDDYLSKPVTIEALRALLRRWLVPEEVEGDAPPTQPTPACEQSADEQRADAAPANEVRSVKDPAAADEAKQTGETRAADDEPLPANDAQPVDEEPLADEPQPTDEAQAADEAQAVPVLSD